MSVLSLTSVELEGSALICMGPISVSVCLASKANPEDNLPAKVRTPTDVLTQAYGAHTHLYIHRYTYMIYTVYIYIRFTCCVVGVSVCRH